MVPSEKVWMGLGVPLGLARLGNSSPVSRRYLAKRLRIPTGGHDNFVHIVDFSDQRTASSRLLDQG